MDSLTETPETSRSYHVYKNDLTIALQSALAAMLCLGLPVGLLFWLIILQRQMPSPPIENFLSFFQDNPVPLPILEMLGAFGWGLFLSRISGYRQWWWVCAATMAGVRAGAYPLANTFLVQWIQRHIPADLSVHMTFGLTLGINVLCVTVTMGLLLGLVLMNWKASLVLAASTGFVSVSAALVTLIILDGLGIRVGTGNAAMPKVTAASTMAAALAGGAILGVVFSRFVRAGFDTLQYATHRADRYNK